MKISWHWIKEFSPDLPFTSVEGMVKSLHECGIGVDTVEERRGDWLLDIEITPNRGDFLSLYGVARQLAALHGTTLLPVSTRPLEEVEETSRHIRVDIEDVEGCPRYACRVIQGVKVGPSPAWLVEKLARVGVHTVNNVVDITNFVMWELGHPLHAFDADRIEGSHLRIRRAGKTERLLPLDGGELLLSPEILVIADAQRPVALAGIMGGKVSSIQNSTQNLVLESAWFHPTVIRKGIAMTGVRSDSSYRFERGTDPDMIPVALDRAAQLISEVSGGKVLRNMVERYPNPDPPRKLSLRYNRITRILGYSISPDEAMGALKRLGYAIGVKTGDQVEVEPPSFRRDVHLEVDLIEDVAQLMGYQHIPEISPAGTFVQVRPGFHERFIESIKKSLTGLGIQETVHFGFIPKDLPGRYPGSNSAWGPCIPLINPLRNDWAVLRSTPFFEMMSTIVFNLHQEAKGVSLFEVGTVFGPNREQKIVCGLGMAGLAAEKTWDHPERSFDLFDLKGTVDHLLETLKLSHHSRWEPIDREPWNPGTALALRVKGVEMAVIGGVTEVQDGHWVWYGQVDLDQMEKVAIIKIPHEVLPKYPAITRDVALTVKRYQRVGELAEVIRDAAGPWLERVTLFDVYEGSPLPADQKNVAFRLVFRSAQDTLRHEQVNQTVEALVAKLEQVCGARLRAERPS